MKEKAIGRKHLDETKEKIRAAHVGRQHSEGHKVKIGIANGTEILVTNLETNEIVKYSSIRQAAKELNTSHVTL